MARPKSIEVANRNMRIIQLVNDGWTYDKISDQMGISRSRISQIVHDRDQEIPDEEYRSKIRTHYESLLHDTLEPLRHGEGKPMTASGTGKVIVYPDGHPQAGEIVEDKSFRLEVVRAETVVLQHLAKLNALEKVKPLVIEEKQPDTTILEQIHKNYEGKLREIQNLRAELELFKAGGIVDADIVEDPSPEPAGDTEDTNEGGVVLPVHHNGDEST